MRSRTLFASGAIKYSFCEFNSPQIRLSRMYDLQSTYDMRINLHNRVCETRIGGIIAQAASMTRMVLVAYGFGEVHDECSAIVQIFANDVHLTREQMKCV